MKGDIDYVGVRAENKKTGEVVYYKPVEISTFWGQVEKNSRGNGDIIGITIVILSVCCCFLVFRRRQQLVQRDYRPLQSNE